MKLKDNLIILFIIFALFGSVATIQIRSTVVASRQSREALDPGQLKAQLDNRIKTGEAFKAQITELENKKESFLKSVPDNTINISKNQELERLKEMSGLTDVTGKGVVVILNDAEKVSEDENVMDYIIHDEDVYNVINELRAAGAQAISINNERIIATSEVRCAGPTIKINNNRYAVPYEIKAIGDSDVLYDNLKDSNIVNYMKEYRKRVDIQKDDNIIIPAFKNDISGLISKLEVVSDDGKEGK